MRLIAFVLVLCAASAPASAQSWKEYSYPDYAFRVSFPAQPTVETTTYPAADGHPAPAQIYSVALDNGVFKMTVADLTNAGLEESAVIDHAVAVLSKDGEIKVNIPARISRVFGRQLSILGADGSRSSIAMFYHDGRLYQIEGKSLPNSNATADAIRFQQSLIFTDNASNGPPGDRGPRRGDRADRGDRDRGGGGRGRRDAAARCAEITPAPDDAAKFDCRNPAGASAPN
jgi:hypothetical protein